MADDEMWSQEPVNIERRPSGSSVISVRMPTEEFHALCDDMERRGEKLSEYVRAAIAWRLRQVNLQIAAPISIGSRTQSVTQLLGVARVAPYTENPSADLTRIDLRVTTNKRA